MNSLRIGIVGCGAAAKRYYVPAFRKHPDLIEHLCLVDKNINQAQELATLFGGGKVFDNHHAIVGQVDGVIIALPHFLHFPIAMDFLNSNVHVLCEKPLAETSEQVSQMTNVAEQKGVHLCVNNTRRMFPAFQAVKEMIDNGRIGKLKSISYIEGNSFAWPSTTGFYVDPNVTNKGVLMDLGPHVLDTICWWIGGEKPTMISCQDDSFGGPESVMSITAKMDNCSIDIMLNRFLELENSYIIIGEDGVIKGKIFDWCNYILETNDGEKETIYSKTKAKTFPDFVEPVIDNFFQTIQGEASPLVQGRGVINSIKMIEEAYQMRKTFKLPWYQQIDLASLPRKGKIIVTGASGFIGCRIVELLQLSGRSNVRAAIHQWSSAARLGRFPVDIVIMDLMNKTEIKDALEGVKYIIHCAKGAGGATDQGTRNLLEIALEKNIKHFIHLSTAEVYGNINGVVYEDTAFQYTGNDYNKTKIDAENACWEFINKGLPVTILRPSIVYGPFSTNWITNFAQLFLRKEGKKYESYGEGNCNLIYIDDLVHAIILMLSKTEAIGQAFNVVGPEIITWNEYFERLNQGMGLPDLPLVKASEAKMRTLAMLPVRVIGSFVRSHFLSLIKRITSASKIADTIFRKIELKIKATPCDDELKLFVRKVKFDSSKINKVLGFTPVVDIDKGLNISCEWLKHNRVI